MLTNEEDNGESMLISNDMMEFVSTKPVWVVRYGIVLLILVTLLIALAVYFFNPGFLDIIKKYKAYK